MTQLVKDINNKLTSELSTITAEIKGKGYTAKLNKNGNIKVGGEIWTFNKLAGNGEIAGCKGTCGEHCKGCYNAENPKKSPCYNFKSYVQYGWETSTVVLSHVRNTTYLRNHVYKAFAEIVLQLTRARSLPIAIRIHSSGEIETTEELILWSLVASKFSTIPFYIYTKNYDVLNQALLNIGALPSNFFINVSIWHEYGILEYNKWKHLPNIRGFVYDDGFDYKSQGLHINVHCPAYDKKGKLHHDQTCQECKWCFEQPHKVCACYSH